jgi:hypothetical protein
MPSYDTMLARLFAVPNNPVDPHDHVHGFLTIDPRTGSVLPSTQLKLGSEFFYPMHFGLHLEWKSLGYWIVGLAALAMLTAFVPWRGTPRCRCACRPIMVDRVPGLVHEPGRVQLAVALTRAWRPRWLSIFP